MSVSIPVLRPPMFSILQRVPNKTLCGWVESFQAEVFTDKRHAFGTGTEVCRRLVQRRHILHPVTPVPGCAATELPARAINPPETRHRGGVPGNDDIPPEEITVKERTQVGRPRHVSQLATKRRPEFPR